MSAFAALSDHRLLAELHELVRNNCALEAQLLAHLGEVDRRRLYLGEGCSSMFGYCVEVLHFSEARAFKRIAAARAAREYPGLLAAVRCGDLHVTAVRLLAPHLTRENSAELISRAKHRTARQIECFLADLHPKVDVVTSVRRVALLAAKAVPSLPKADEVFAGARIDGSAEPKVPAPAVLRPLIHATPGSNSKADPLGGGRYQVRFTASPETHAQLLELQALLRHKFPGGDLGTILGHAVAVLHKQVRKQKFAVCEKPRGKARAGDVCSSGAEPQAARRGIPAAIRRAVAERDGGRCTYVSSSGRRCSARDFIEFHHEIPWARDPSHEVDNVTLRCRAHNQYAAERDFGREYIAKFRKTGDGDAASGATDRVDRQQGRTGSLALRPVVVGRPTSPDLIP